MAPDQILNIFQFGILIKLFFVVLGIFYLVLVAVIYRQIQLMTQILHSRISPLLQMVAMGQMVAGGVLLLLTLILA